MNKNYIFGIGILLAVLLIFAAPAAAHSVYFEPQHSSASTGNSTYVKVYLDLDAGETLLAGQLEIMFDNETADITKISKKPDEPANYSWNNFWQNLAYSENGYAWNGVADPFCEWDDEEEEWILCSDGLIHGPAHVKICRYKIEAVGTPGTTPLVFGDEMFPDACPVCQRCKFCNVTGEALDITWVDGTFTHEGVGPQTYTVSGYTDPAATRVNITNLDKSGAVDERPADYIDPATGFYNLTLDVPGEVEAGNVLQITACDEPSNYESNCNVTNHTVVNAPGEDVNVNLTLDHYCLNYCPDYPFRTWEDGNWSGPAVMQMMVDHYRPEEPSQSDLNAAGIAHNQDPCNVDLEFVDPKGMRWTLNDILHDTSSYGGGDYANYGIGNYDNLESALHYICYWQHLGHGAAPTGGDYSNWMAIRGIHTSENPYPQSAGSYDIYGFWINDPNPTGIGENTYKTVDQWASEYYESLTGVNGCDDYLNRYIAVCEPPEQPNRDITVVPAKPRLAGAVIPALMQESLNVDGTNWKILQRTLLDEDSLKMIQAAIDGVNEELVPYDQAFADVFAETVPGIPKLVQNADGCDDYYIVPFVEEGNTDVNRTLVVVLVDADDGSFKEASWVADPVKYLPVSKREALRLVLEEILANQLKAFGMPSIELVDSGSSPYLPDWKITRGNYVFSVTQDGVLSYEVIARNWPQFHYDAANTGYTTSYAPDLPNLLWDSGDIGAVASSQPLVVRNKVIVWADETVYVLDKATGAEIWNGSVAGDTLGYGSWATPAYNNLALFVSSGYNLTKFDVASGTTTDITFPDGGYSCNGGPTVADGMVFAGSGYDMTSGESPTHYYAFNESDLTEVWNFSVGAWNAASSTPAVADGKVFVGSGTKIYCLNETTGLEVWNYTTTASGWPYMAGSLTYADGYVYGAYYVFDVAGADGPVYKLDAETGVVQSGWPVTVKATDSTPAVVDDRVYICGGCSPYDVNYEYNGVGVYCFDTGGNKIWENVSDETELIMGSWTCSPAVADGMVFVGDPSNAYGEMFEFNGTYALDAATGAVEWYLPYGGASPAVADDMVFTIARGHVYAFGLLKTYGESVYSKNKVRRAWAALGKPDRRGAIMRKNARIAIELEETIPNCTTVSVWARKVAVQKPSFDVYVSSDGASWTEIGSATCNKWRWQRFDFTGDWEDVKYIEIRKSGSRWRPKLMGLDAVYAEGVS